MKISLDTGQQTGFKDLYSELSGSHLKYISCFLQVSPDLRYFPLQKPSYSLSCTKSAT